MRISLAVLVLLAMVYTGLVARRDGRGSVAATWLGSLIAFTVGTGLYVADGTPLQAYTAPFANMAAVAGGCLMIATARRIRGVALPWWLFATVVAGAGGSTLLEDPSANAWAGGAYMLIALGACAGATAFELWQHDGRLGRGEVRVMAVVASVLTVFYTVRWVLYILQGPESAAFATIAGSGVTALIQMVSIATVTQAVSQLAHVHSRADLERRAITDDLTGVLNRGELFLRAERAVLRWDPSQRLVIAIADLDRFKSVNDSRGHAEGDRALVEFTRAWREVLGPDDILGRMGGDEFVIVMRDVEIAEAVARARAVTRTFGETCAADCGATPTASHGLAAAEDGLGLAILMARADEALYEAKRAGRNTEHVYRAPRRVDDEVTQAT
ncbi:GGDEF domain-containing protein [Demequina gelatinilytica]|uniref:GGDEF domain-containing protein n=1 Tax=Demequina gelatinilytica TaxID=1638980 RepID=UPI0012E02B25|nr:GGDEF domain-containing protein [Demequina gelatinilytica]